VRKEKREFLQVILILVLCIAIFSGLMSWFLLRMEGVRSRLKSTILAPETKDYTTIDAYDEANCTTFQKEKVKEVLNVLENAGLFGDHPLVPIIGNRGLEGEFQGGFLRGTSGKVSTYTQLTFAWKTTDGREFVSSLKYDKVIFIEIPEGEPPRIRFKFNGERLMYTFKHRDPTALHNLNFFITDDVIAYATIYVSQEAKESNLYFFMR